MLRKAVDSVFGDLVEQFVELLRADRAAFEIARRIGHHAEPARRFPGPGPVTERVPRQRTAVESFQIEITAEHAAEVGEMGDAVLRAPHHQQDFEDRVADDQRPGAHRKRSRKDDELPVRLEHRRADHDRKDGARSSEQPDRRIPVQDQEQQIAGHRAGQVEPQEPFSAEIGGDQAAEDVKTPHVEEEVPEIDMQKSGGHQLENLELPDAVRAQHQRVEQRFRHEKRTQEHAEIDQDQREKHAPPAVVAAFGPGIRIAHIASVEQTHRVFPFVMPINIIRPGRYSNFRCR